MTSITHASTPVQSIHSKNEQLSWKYLIDSTRLEGFWMHIRVELWTRPGEVRPPRHGIESYAPNATRHYCTGARQMGQFASTLCFSQRAMHSWWNTWPHGRLSAWPFWTTSSRQITQSISVVSLSRLTLEISSRSISLRGVASFTMSAENSGC